VAIVDLLPGGFEVVDHRSTRTCATLALIYVDVREDRAVFF